MTTTRSVVGLVFSVLLCLAVGVSASMVTATSVGDWYASLQKPSWTPPNAAFAPVWSALYILMGVSVWIVWRETVGRPRRTAVSLFVVQLLLNALWSFIFFGLRSPGWALFEIVLLWIAISATILVFRRINWRAAALMVPYLIWVSFALALNSAVWILNS